LKQASQYMSDLVALDLWEMFYAFADIGFGAAGDPENMKNTEEVILPPFDVDKLSLAFISTPGLST